MKYKILRCTGCGLIGGYAKGIRTKCPGCGKKIKIDFAFVLGEFEKPGEAGFVIQRVKEELARKKCEFEKGATYTNRRE